MWDLSQDLSTWLKTFSKSMVKRLRSSSGSWQWTVASQPLAVPNSNCDGRRYRGMSSDTVRCETPQRGTGNPGDLMLTAAWRAHTISSCKPRDNALSAWTRSISCGKWHTRQSWRDGCSPARVCNKVTQRWTGNAALHGHKEASKKEPKPVLHRNLLLGKSFTMTSIIRNVLSDCWNSSHDILAQSPRHTYSQWLLMQKADLPLAGTVCETQKVTGNRSNIL